MGALKTCTPTFARLPGTVQSVLRYIIIICIATPLSVAMPVSLRLPADLEAQLAEFGARHNTTKSAVIVRSVRDFLALHAAPSMQDLYAQAMDAAERTAPTSDTARTETRPHKLAFRERMQQKRAVRTASVSA